MKPLNVDVNDDVYVEADQLTDISFDMLTHVDVHDRFHVETDQRDGNFFDTLTKCD